MKIIITESQRNLLWLQRRLHLYTPSIIDIIREGHEYISPCDYNNENGYEEYLQEILYGSAITFINGELYDWDFEESQYESIYKLVYHYMKENFEDIIKERYDDEMELCNED